MAAKVAGFVSSNDELSPDGTLALAVWIMIFSLGKKRIGTVLSHEKDKFPVKCVLVNKSSNLSLRRRRDELSCL